MSLTSRIFALIPAAGKSTRMGAPKLALPFGNRTILECVIAALRQADIGDILVVLGPHVANLAETATSTGANVLVLKAETPDMRATIEQGLTWIEQNRRPEPEQMLLLLPGDHPTLNSEIIRALVAARAAHPHSSLFVPTFAGKRGHPTLIAWSHVPGIRALPPHQGLNSYLRQQPVVEIPMTSDEVLRDLDTPEDYERLLSKR